MSLFSAQSRGSSAQCESLFNFDRQINAAVTAELAADEFARGRGLEELMSTMEYKKNGRTRNILTDIRALKDGDHLVDSGTGKGYVLADIYKAIDTGYFAARGTRYPMPGVRLFATAIGYVRPEEWTTKALPDIGAHHIDVRYLYGRYIEAIPNNEIANGRKAKIVIDSVGSFSYSDRIDVVLQKYIDFSEPDAGINISFDKMPDRNRTLPSAPKLIGGSGYMTEVLLKDGRRVSVIDWIESIPGLKVYRARKWAVHIEKTRPDVVVPRLALVEYIQGRPPFRVFVEIE